MSGILAGVPIAIVLWLLIIAIVGPAMTLAVGAAIFFSLVFTAITFGFFFNVP